MDGDTEWYGPRDSMPKPLPDPIRREAIHAVVIEGKSRRDVAEKLGISPLTVGKWVRQAKKDTPENAELVDVLETIARRYARFLLSTEKPDNLARNAAIIMGVALDKRRMLLDSARESEDHSLALAWLAKEAGPGHHE